MAPPPVAGAEVAGPEAEVVPEAPAGRVDPVGQCLWERAPRPHGIVHHNVVHIDRLVLPEMHAAPQRLSHLVIPIAVFGWPSLEAHKLAVETASVRRCFGYHLPRSCHSPP